MFWSCSLCSWKESTGVSFIIIVPNPYRLQFAQPNEHSTQPLYVVLIFVFNFSTFSFNWYSLCFLMFEWICLLLSSTFHSMSTLVLCHNSSILSPWFYALVSSLYLLSYILVTLPVFLQVDKVSMLSIGLYMHLSNYFSCQLSYSLHNAVHYIFLPVQFLSSALICCSSLRDSW